MLACCITSRRCFYNTKLETWMNCYHNNRALVWDNGYLGLCLQLAGVSLGFCSLKVTRIQYHSAPRSKEFLRVVPFCLGWVVFCERFSCWQWKDSSPWQTKSCSDSFPILKHGPVYKTDENGSYKEEYILQLFFHTYLWSFPFCLYMQAKT